VVLWGYITNSLSGHKSLKKEEVKMEKLIRFLKDEEGTSMVEWGLLAALIVIVCIALMTLVGTNLKQTFNKVALNLQ